MDICFIAFQLSAAPPFGFPVQVAWITTNGCTECRFIRPDWEWKGWDHRYTEDLHGITQADVFSAGDGCEYLLDWLNSDLREQQVFACDGDVARQCLKTLSWAAHRRPEFAISDLPKSLEKFCNKYSDAEAHVVALSRQWHTQDKHTQRVQEL